MKILKWVGITIVVLFFGLMGLGAYMHSTAEAFMTSNGFTDVKVVGTDNRVLCSGSKTGLVVKATAEGEEKYYPICVNIIGKTELGRFGK